MRRVASLLIGVFLLFAAPQTSLAQNGSEFQCRKTISERLAEEHMYYRRALFGSTGSVVVESGSGFSVLRTGGFAPPEKEYGIFETPERLTSELVEPITEAYRTFRCRSVSVCELFLKSATSETATDVTIETLGCMPLERTTMTECYVGDKASTISVNLEQFCQDVVKDTLALERRILHLAVAYDTGYRALLQFTGIFDAFLVEAPKRTFTVLREMVALLGRLHQIPCFTAHCDMPPMESVPPDIVF